MPFFTAIVWPTSLTDSSIETKKDNCGAKETKEAGLFPMRFSGFVLESVPHFTRFCSPRGDGKYFFLNLAACDPEGGAVSGVGGNPRVIQVLPRVRSALPPCAKAKNHEPLF